MTGNPALISAIRDEIRDGPMAFARFMELALYHPEHGYYSSGRAMIGRGGDFFTNVSVGPTFGRLLGAQFVEMWEKLGRPDEFTIVEQGANDGQFARDVLQYARAACPAFFAALRYTIVEPFARLAERQREVLRQSASIVEWRTSLDALDSFTGLHFSNELFDAVSVHLLVSTGSDWLERCVTDRDDSFAFVELPICDTELQYLAASLPPCPAGYFAEISTSAQYLIDRIATKLTRGYVLALDYGLGREELLAANRATGTLQIRSKHRVIDSPLERVGEADITAHVNWTSIAEAAEARGLRVAGFCDQHHFLTGIIAQNRPLAHDAKSTRALQTLLHPEMLGRSFQALILARDADPQLSGLRYARDPRRALGLAAPAPQT